MIITVLFTLPSVIKISILSLDLAFFLRHVELFDLFRCYYLTDKIYWDRDRWYLHKGDEFDESTWTGIALVNPQEVEAEILIEVVSEVGISLSSFSVRQFHPVLR